MSNLLEFGVGMSFMLRGTSVMGGQLQPIFQTNQFAMTLFRCCFVLLVTNNEVSQDKQQMTSSFISALL